MPERETRQMSVIKKPAEGTRPIIELLPAGRMTGHGDVDYVCGGCKYVLIATMHPGQIIDLVIKCPNCHCHNETLD